MVNKFTHPSEGRNNDPLTDTAFMDRFAVHWPRATAALGQVYGRQQDYLCFLDRLKNSLCESDRTRSAALKKLDAKRAAEPDWFQKPDRIGYSAYADRFAGTLKGIIGKIPYLTDLGVTYLHLLPVYVPQSGDNDGGFAVADHRRVDPRLGDIDDLRMLAAALNEAGITLCLDIVCNHTARDHDWAVRALRGERSFQDRYHILHNYDEVVRRENDLDQVFPSTAPGNFTFEAALKGWVWTSFYPFQWDLNYANSAVFEELVSLVLFLANLGAGCLRLDAVPYIWKQAGTKSKNLPEVHALLTALRAILDIVAPGTFVKAEAIAPMAETLPYFGGGTECHIAYHNGLMAILWAALATGSISDWRPALAALPPAPPHSNWLLYLRCHDDIGWEALLPFIGDKAQANAIIAGIADFYEGKSGGSFAKGVPFQDDGPGQRRTNGMLASLAGLSSSNPIGEEMAERRILLLYGILLAFPGLPVLWMGDEIGLVNWQASPDKDSRWAQRPYMDWRAADSQRQDKSVPASEDRLYNRIKRLIALRGRMAAFHAEAPIHFPEDGPDCVLAFTRGAQDNTVMVLGNFSDRPKTISRYWLELHAANMREDAIQGFVLNPENDLILAPYQVAWLFRPPIKNAFGDRK
jgi:amylosucrase